MLQWAETQVLNVPCNCVTEMGRVDHIVPSVPTGNSMGFFLTGYFFLVLPDA